MASRKARRETPGLRVVVLGLCAGALLGALCGAAIVLLLASRNAHMSYNILLRGGAPFTVARLFAGNSLLALLLHYVPALAKRSRSLPAILIGTVGFVLGFFLATADMRPQDLLLRLPHTVLEVFAYVIAARGGRLWPVFPAIAAASLFEWALVLRPA